MEGPWAMRKKFLRKRFQLSWSVFLSHKTLDVPRGLKNVIFRETCASAPRGPKTGGAAHLAGGPKVHLHCLPSASALQRHLRVRPPGGAKPQQITPQPGAWLLPHPHPHLLQLLPSLRCSPSSLYSLGVDPLTHSSPFPRRS